MLQPGSIEASLEARGAASVYFLVRATVGPNWHVRSLPHSTTLPAELLASRLAHRLMPAGASPDGWLDAKQAATYLGLSVHTLHKLTASQALPFEQDGPGCKCWFKASEPDAWRSGEWLGRRGRRAA